MGNASHCPFAPPPPPLFALTLSFEIRSLSPTLTLSRHAAGFECCCPHLNIARLLRHEQAKQSDAIHRARHPLTPPPTSEKFSSGEKRNLSKEPEIGSQFELRKLLFGFIWPLTPPPPSVQVTVATKGESLHCARTARYF